MNETKAQLNYKDSFFCMLFKDKENLLNLYNALNRTDYTDIDELEITTLENAVYMNYKNDVSFVEGCEEGLELGENRLAELIQTLMDAGRNEDVIRAISDPEYRKQLYLEKA